MSTFTFDGHVYEVITTPMSWGAARVYADSKQAYLAIINSKAENEAIFAQVAPLLPNSPIADDGGGSAYVWLGASDVESEGNWIWVDDTPLSSGYTNWGSGFKGTEPDDYTGQDAMGMGLEVWPQGSGGYGVASQWNDIDENNLLYFVMESEPPLRIIESSVSYTLKADETALRLTGTKPLIGKGNTNPNTLTGNDGNNKLYGLEGDDQMSGGLGNDGLDGGDGNDTLDGGSGIDKLAGGRGNDVYVINDTARNGKAADTITEKAGQGNDTVLSGISLTLAAEVENLMLTQSTDSQGIGNKGANVITGNSGANLIDGKEGNDTLAGGDGADVFVFSTKPTVTNIDTISDFETGVDKIQLVSKVFKGIKSGADVIALGLIVYDSSSGTLSYDGDGAGTKSKPIDIALIGKGLALTSADFIVV